MQRELTYFRNGDSTELVTIPRGEIVHSVTLRRLDPWNRKSFEKWMKLEKEEGYPRGMLVSFRFADGWRGAFRPRDLVAA